MDFAATMCLAASHGVRQAVFNDIWDYIAGDNVEAAARVLEVLERAMRKLAWNPCLGHEREGLANKRHCFFSAHS